MGLTSLERDILQDINRTWAKIHQEGSVPQDELQRLGDLWTKTLGDNLCTIWSPPCRTFGTGALAGEHWDTPGNIMILLRNQDITQDQIHGRGLAIQDGDLAFYTELDEAYEEDPFSMTFAAKMLAEWVKQLRRMS